MRFTLPHLPCTTNCLPANLIPLFGHSVPHRSYFYTGLTANESLSLFTKNMLSEWTKTTALKLFTKKLAYLRVQNKRGPWIAYLMWGRHIRIINPTAMKAMKWTCDDTIRSCEAKRRAKEHRARIIVVTGPIYVGAGKRRQSGRRSAERHDAARRPMPPPPPHDIARSACHHRLTPRLTHCKNCGIKSRHRCRPPSIFFFKYII